MLRIPITVLDSSSETSADKINPRHRKAMYLNGIRELKTIIDTSRYFIGVAPVEASSIDFNLANRWFGHERFAYNIIKRLGEILNLRTHEELDTDIAMLNSEDTVPGWYSKTKPKLRQIAELMYWDDIIRIEDQWHRKIGLVPDMSPSLTNEYPFHSAVAMLSFSPAYSFGPALYSTENIRRLFEQWPHLYRQSFTSFLGNNRYAGIMGISYRQARWTNRQNSQRMVRAGFIRSALRERARRVFVDAAPAAPAAPAAEISFPNVQWASRSGNWGVGARNGTWETRERPARPEQRNWRSARSPESSQESSQEPSQEEIDQFYSRRLGEVRANLISSAERQIAVEFTSPSGESFQTIWAINPSEIES